ncbi:putative Nucleic acid-binding, OB-fold, Cold-shock protein [Pseudoloma neurophilia]|uniref:Putative Nucleic acid-binding, OB-fold, Cold-shock protein n=1 Tax=Pseudoloma neurophilia TaxID=146866 RepID=A0A0R0LT54_9MICR|nr:putative Nucleic acid-binding, OB-fold, Cold-shock protein [Pseudoloma neurophilia]
MVYKKRCKGTIKFFSYEKGYGFLIPSDCDINEDVFFHFSSISNKPGMIVYLLPKQVCEFDLVKGPRGYLAKNVTSVQEFDTSIENNSQNITLEGNMVEMSQSDDHGLRTNKQNDIFHHYYHSFRKIMDKMIEEEIKKMKEK